MQPCSQQPATSVYPKRDESISHSTLFFMNHCISTLTKDGLFVVRRLYMFVCFHLTKVLQRSRDEVALHYCVAVQITSLDNKAVFPKMATGILRSDD